MGDGTLPDNYANSLLLTLDEDIIGHGKSTNSSSFSHELVDNSPKSSMPNHDNFHGEITASTTHSYAVERLRGYLGRGRLFIQE